MIETLLSKLEKVKRTGHGKYIACCPCHYDKTPSLSIKDNENTILIHCFGCGASGVDVCDALGIDVTGLFPPTDNYNYDRHPQRKMAIGADQALQALQTESTIIYMIAMDMLDKGSIDQETKDRLLVACSRVHTVTALYKEPAV